MLEVQELFSRNHHSSNSVTTTRRSTRMTRTLLYYLGQDNLCYTDWIICLLCVNIFIIIECMYIFGIENLHFSMEILTKIGGWEK